MKLHALLVMVLLAIGSPAVADEWQSLFDGKTLDGWKAVDNEEGFRVEEGAIVGGGGPMAHLFYVGPVGNHDFKNFELKMQVKTKAGSNGGIFFHTEPQTGALKKGYEAQVSTTHKDLRRTGSLLVIQDNSTSPVEDDQWFDYDILVDGKRIVLKIDGETTVDYTEPENPERPKGREGRVLSHGQIALQGHDPDSRVYYRHIRIRLLPD